MDDMPNYSPTLVAIESEHGNLSEAEKMERVLNWGEEQPHFYGFLFNLSDDFSETEHTALLHLVLLLQDMFKRTGLRIDTITPKILEEAIKSAQEPERVAGESSQRTETLLFETWRRWTGADSSRKDMELICRVLVSSFERSVPEKLQ
jgi:hypothetical protein